MRRDYAKHRQVAETLFEHSLQAVRDSELPVIEATDEQQRGQGFGERFANAVADAFAQGYEHVIAVGGDCPHLHEVDWTAVAERLDGGVPVLGPTPEHDGAYLIGLTRDQFDRKQFEALPWQSPGLLSVLSHHLTERAGTAPALLAVREDVNGHEELLSLLHTPTALPTSLALQLRRVLGDSGREIHLEAATTARRVSSRRSRAPPEGLVVPTERVLRS